MAAVSSNKKGPVFLSHKEGCLPDVDTILSALSSNVRLLTSELEEASKNEGENSAHLHSMIEDSLSVSNEIACRKIDALLLEQSQQESSTGGTTHAIEKIRGASCGIPGADDKQFALDEYAQDSSSLDDCRQSDDDNDATKLPAELRKAPRITAEIEGRELAALSDKDRMDIHVDIYGHKPTNEQILEECMAAFDSELGKIPAVSKRALLQAQRAFPLLCCSSSHAMLFLQAENFNPKPAAERMVRYWEKRVKFYGDLAFTSHAFTRPMEEDYLRLYEKSTVAASDPGVDEETREIAAQYVRNWDNTKVINMERVLEKIPSHEKTAFIKVQKTRPDLVTPKVKLQFLRSVDFKEDHAAQRMVNYWETKFELFGDDCAMKPITQETLKEQGNELSMGFIHLLPGTDAFGRALICLTPSKLSKGHKQEGLLKVTWYMFHAALEEESAQKNGIVLLTVIKSSRLENYDMHLMSKMGRIINACIPVKPRAIHYCDPPVGWWLNWIYPIMKWVIGEKLRRRHLVHVGTTEQTLSALEECGISRNQLPSEIGGSLELDYLQVWLMERRAAGL